MTQQEADKIVMGMGCHPYSRLAMIDALLEGEKIGKREQKAIDEDHFREVTKMLIDKACKWLIANADNYYESSSQADNCYFDTDEMVEAFRKAMEEEA